MHGFELVEVLDDLAVERGFVARDRENDVSVGDQAEDHLTVELVRREDLLARGAPQRLGGFHDKRDVVGNGSETRDDHFGLVAFEALEPPGRGWRSSQQ